MFEIKTIHYPHTYEDVKKLGPEYLKRGYLLVSFEKFKRRSDAKKLADFLIGMTWAKGGLFFRFNKIMFFTMIPEVGSCKVLDFTYKGGRNENTRDLRQK